METDASHFGLTNQLGPHILSSTLGLFLVFNIYVTCVTAVHTGKPTTKEAWGVLQAKHMHIIASLSPLILIKLRYCECCYAFADPMCHFHGIQNDIYCSLYSRVNCLIVIYLKQFMFVKLTFPSSSSDVLQNRMWKFLLSSPICVKCIWFAITFRCTETCLNCSKFQASLSFNPFSNTICLRIHIF